MIPGMLALPSIPASATWSLLDPWLLLVAPLVWIVFGWRITRSSAALPCASGALLAGLPQTLRARLWLLPVVLQMLALSAFVIALSRPVARDVMPLREMGIEILLLIDVSNSMMASDMDDDGRLTRIEVSRDRALEFAKARTHDRVGLVTFARSPEVRCPLTLDQDALAAFLRSVEAVPEQSEENQTGIGVALAKATTLLEKTEAKSKVVVLLSDGENNIPDIMPEDAAKLAKDAGVKVYCIGVGGSRVINDPIFGHREFKPEFRSLKAIAKIAAGEFFQAESDRELADVYRRIDELQKVELEDPRYRTVEMFHYPLCAGVVLLVLQLLAEFVWIRKVP